jgi:hypothetical protein
MTLSAVAIIVEEDPQGCSRRSRVYLQNHVHKQLTVSESSGEVHSYCLVVFEETSYVHFPLVKVLLTFCAKTEQLRKRLWLEVF